MPSGYTVVLQPEIADFVRSRAQTENISVTDFIEALVLREKARLDDTEQHLTVMAAPELLAIQDHELIRDADESDSEYEARSALFAALLDHARLS